MCLGRMVTVADGACCYNRSESRGLCVPCKEASPVVVMADRGCLMASASDAGQPGNGQARYERWGGRHRLVERLGRARCNTCTTVPGRGAGVGALRVFAG